MLSVYDFHMARIAADSGIDMLLVGDSVGMVVYGDSDTRSVTIEEMIRHGRAVVRGADDKVFTVVDMPYKTCDSTESAVDNCRRVVAQTGCDAVKIEGVPEIVKAVVEAGIEVMAHTGLKPQTAERYCVQGGDELQRREIIDEAMALQSAGAFAMVLECVPKVLGEELTSVLSIPTVGIGAGNGCDGQVLVLHDLLGISERKLPKFVKEFVNIETVIKKGIVDFCEQVGEGDFPSDLESYS